MEVLRDLYGKVQVPHAVADELRRGLQGGISLPRLEDHNWIVLVDIPIPKQLALTINLGPGEMAVIAGGLAGFGGLLLLDDLRARAKAKSLGLAVTGTIGVLSAARRQGIIPSLSIELDKLESCGFRLSSALRLALDNVDPID